MTDAPRQRIDTHHHTIPDFYRARLAAAGIDNAGGRALPDWSPDESLTAMANLQVSSAVLSVSTPGTTFLDDAADATALAKQLNDYGAQLITSNPGRFGYFATLPTPHIGAAIDEATRSLDDLHLDGVVLLANSTGAYLGAPEFEPLWPALDERHAVVFIHPADLPAPAPAGIPPFVADFLLDTTRAAYLLVRNEVIRRYPHIRFILSHAGGFVPYASHRMAIAIAGETGRALTEVLDDFASFYFDTALSSSPAALPTLLAFARPGHVLYGSDWPFAPTLAGQYFTATLDQYPLDTDTRTAIDSTAAAALFPRLARPDPSP